MDLYLNEWDYEITKYNDVYSIYNKMKENKYFKNIQRNLIEIFVEESKFASGEINKIAGKDKSIDIEEQINLNFNIFKSNLKIIFNNTSIIISK